MFRQLDYQDRVTTALDAYLDLLKATRVRQLISQLIDIANSDFKTLIWMPPCSQDDFRLLAC